MTWSTKSGLNLPYSNKEIMQTLEEYYTSGYPADFAICGNTDWAWPYKRMTYLELTDEMTREGGVGGNYQDDMSTKYGA